MLRCGHGAAHAAAIFPGQAHHSRQPVCGHRDLRGPELVGVEGRGPSPLCGVIGASVAVYRGVAAIEAAIVLAIAFALGSLVPDIECYNFT